MFAELYVLTGRDAGKGLTATPGPSIYLGRAATNQLRIRDSVASRVHCRIDVGADGLTLHDNNSGNGTFVNGERVARSKRLDDGDTIKVGTTEIRVLIETEEDRERWGSLSAAPTGDGPQAIRVAPRDHASDAREGSGLSAEPPATPPPAASASATTESLESLSETWADQREAGAETLATPPPAQRTDSTPATERRALREVLPGYVLEARLGGKHREGMAVYRARQRSLDRVVAVRVLVSKSGGGIDPLLREARAIARLPHPHVVVIHDLIQRGSIQALVMEFLGGGSLLDRLGPSVLPLAQSLTLAEGVASALAYAHEHGIVHRNVRPSNVLFAPESGSWKLCDFGAAAGPAQPRAGDTTFLGTPLPGFGYLAPEQLGQDPAADPRIDVYGLGATLHACLTGQPPFSGETTPEIGAAIMRDPPPAIPSAPESLQRLVARCLAKDPKDRWADGKALLHELGACRAALSSLDDGS